MSSRIHNFNPGPSAFSLSVLEQIQDELSEYQGSDGYFVCIKGIAKSANLCF